jgi:hypothetical protein
LAVVRWLLSGDFYTTASCTQGRRATEQGAAHDRCLRRGFLRGGNSCSVKNRAGGVGGV